MTQVKHIQGATHEAASRNLRNFRTFLLVAQFEAKEIGVRIAQARVEAGMTQEELAETASFSKRSLQDYEAGITIPYRHLREIGRLLGRPPEWLLHGDDPTDEADQARLEELLGRVIELLEAVLAERLPQEPAGAASRRRG